MRRFFLPLVLLLAGCAASAQTRPAYVDVNALMQRHPLYGALAQYDRQIAVLQGTLRTGFANADAQIDNASRDVRADAEGAANKYDAVASQTQNQPYPNAPAKPSGSAAYDVAADINDAYQQQHAQLRGTAQRDMDTYRAALNKQQQQAYDAFVSSMNARMQQAIAMRAQELREHDANLSLELAQQDSSARTKLHAKLQTLYLRPEVRKSLLAQLSTLQAREDAQLAASERADAKMLAAYAAGVRARAQSDLDHMRADLTSRGAANLAARERVLQSQTSGGASVDIPSAPAATGPAVDMKAAYAKLNGSALPGDAAFSSAADDLTANWKALKAANDDGNAHTRSQIESLRHDREAVRKRIVAQILYEADRIAKERGYSDAVDGRAPSGSPDITQAVAADLKTLSP